MRVIAGTARSIRLHVPEGKDIRPTIDRFKETLFNMIQDQIPGATFLDIFAGSGAIGIEALSRGAQSATFIEHSAQSMDCIKENLNNTKLFEKAKLLKYDYSKALSILGDSLEKYDIIFADPPYEQGFEAKIVEEILEAKLLKEGGLLILECSSQTNRDFLKNYDALYWYKEKVFKTSTFTFMKK